MRIAIALPLFFYSFASAQVTGRITDAVSDPGGGVVPKAIINLLRTQF